MLWGRTAGRARLGQLARGGALGPGDRVGPIAPGFEADVVALEGDPLKDITDGRRVVFVMKAGVVYKNDARARAAVTSER